MCTTSYFLSKVFTTTTTTSTTTTTPSRTRPVAIAHVFLAEGVGGASVASDRGSAPRKGMDRFRKSGGDHESSDNPPSNQEESGEEKRPLPLKEE